MGVDRCTKRDGVQRNPPISVESVHNVDPANTASPQSRLTGLKSVQQHKALLGSTTAELQQTAISQCQTASLQQTQAVLTTQVLKLRVVLLKMTPASPAAPSSSTPSWTILVHTPRVETLEQNEGDSKNSYPYLILSYLILSSQTVPREPVVLYLLLLLYLALTNTISVVVLVFLIGFCPHRMPQGPMQFIFLIHDAYLDVGGPGGFAINHPGNHLICMLDSF